MILLRHHATLSVILALAAVSLVGCAGESVGSSTGDWAEVQAQIDDDVRAVDAFWSATYPDHFSGEYRSPWNIWSFDSEDPDQVPMCADQFVPPENAIYCAFDGSLVWDEQLMSVAYASGDVVVGLIVAHEWGHVVQSQLQEHEVWPAVELQADCFAGAASSGAWKSAGRTITSAEEDALRSTLDSIGDPAPWSAAGDHGSGAERSEAFALGRSAGVSGCLADPLERVG